MAEVPALAYQRIRNFWRGEAVRMQIGNAAMTTSTTRSVGDAEPPDAPAYSSGDGDNPQVVAMMIQGSDADVAQGVTYERVRLLQSVAAGGGILADETFDPVAIITDNDQLTVTMNIEIPDIV